MDHRGLLVTIYNLALNEVLVHLVHTSDISAAVFIKLLSTTSIAFDSLFPLSRRILVTFRLLLVFPISNRSSFPALHRFYNSCFSEVNAVY